MYNQFFGFKEKPFKLVPNPDYLFMSRSHEEAMAHLTYAISQGDGFAEITGEVGTGKTTICRAFLENLDENTEAAYIFNPKMDSIQLLKAINDEFGISSDADNTKDLIDTLNLFLMERRAAGKQAILLIDEAQNLSEELLEQLRLLSNLETTTDKLLQIILVGQPELGDTLDSYDLRQLGQRITLSCHLFPLTYKETKEYIQHRMHIASQKPAVKFTRFALRYIYRFSGGVPRLINIACDRMLLIAFGHNQHRITGHIARKANRELASRGNMRPYWSRTWERILFAALLLCIALAVLLLYRPEILRLNTPSKILGSKRGQSLPVKERKTKTGPKPILIEETKEGQEPDSGEAKPQEEQLGKFGDFLEGMDREHSRQLALKSAMLLWGAEAVIKQTLEAVENDHNFFRLAAKQNRLLIRRIEGDLNVIKNFNLPAVLEFYHPGGLFPVYLTLIRIGENQITLKSGNDVMKTGVSEAEPYWSGVAYIPWKNFLDLQGTIPSQSTKDSIITLKILLREIGFNDIEVNANYDERTREAIKQIQKRHGLKVDGIVGGSTKIALYNEKKSFNIPHIIH